MLFLFNKIDAQPKIFTKKSTAKIIKGEYFGFSSNCALFNTASSAAPSSSTVTEDARIEPRTVSTLALTARRFNH